MNLLDLSKYDSDTLSKILEQNLRIAATPLPRSHYPSHLIQPVSSRSGLADPFPNSPSLTALTDSERANSRVLPRERYLSEEQLAQEQAQKRYTRDTEGVRQLMLMGKEAATAIPSMVAPAVGGTAAGLGALAGGGGMPGFMQEYDTFSDRAKQVVHEVVGEPSQFMQYVSEVGFEPAQKYITDKSGDPRLAERLFDLLGLTLTGAGIAKVRGGRYAKAVDDLDLKAMEVNKPSWVTDTTVQAGKAGLVAGGAVALGIPEMLRGMSDSELQQLATTIPVIAGSLIGEKGKNYSKIAASWVDDMDGRTKKMISDEGMTLVKPVLEQQLNRLAAPNRNLTEVKMGQIIQHPELFDNYPDKLDTTVQLRKNGTFGSGLFDNEKNAIIINGVDPAKVAKKAAEEGVTPEELLNNTLLNVILHESEHGTQFVEGWNLGTDPKLTSGDAQYRRKGGEWNSEGLAVRNRNRPVAEWDWSGVENRVPGNGYWRVEYPVGKGDSRFESFPTAAEADVFMAQNPRSKKQWVEMPEVDGTVLRPQSIPDVNFTAIEPTVKPPTVKQRIAALQQAIATEKDPVRKKDLISQFTELRNQRLTDAAPVPKEKPLIDPEGPTFQVKSINALSQLKPGLKMNGPQLQKHLQQRGISKDEMTSLFGDLTAEPIRPVSNWLSLAQQNAPKIIEETYGGGSKPPIYESYFRDDIDKFGSENYALSRLGVELSEPKNLPITTIEQLVDLTPGELDRLVDENGTLLSYASASNRIRNNKPLFLSIEDIPKKWEETEHDDVTTRNPLGGPVTSEMSLPSIGKVTVLHEWQRPKKVSEKAASVEAAAKKLHKERSVPGSSWEELPNENKQHWLEEARKQKERNPVPQTLADRAIELIGKKVVADAVKAGHAGILLQTGPEIAKRWNLNNWFDEARYNPETQMLTMMKGGNVKGEPQKVPPNKLGEILNSQELADRLLASKIPEFHTDWFESIDGWNLTGTDWAIEDLGRSKYKIYNKKTGQEEVAYSEETAKRRAEKRANKDIERQHVLTDLNVDKPWTAIEYGRWEGAEGPRNSAYEAKLKEEYESTDRGEGTSNWDDLSESQKSQFEQLMLEEVGLRIPPRTTASQTYISGKVANTLKRLTGGEIELVDVGKSARSSDEAMQDKIYDEVSTDVIFENPEVLEFFKNESTYKRAKKGYETGDEKFDDDLMEFVATVHDYIAKNPDSPVAVKLLGENWAGEAGNSFKQPFLRFPKDTPKTFSIYEWAAMTGLTAAALEKLMEWYENGNDDEKQKLAGKYSFLPAMMGAIATKKGKEYALTRPTNPFKSQEPTLYSINGMNFGTRGEAVQFAKEVGLPTNNIKPQWLGSDRGPMWSGNESNIQELITPTKSLVAVKLRSNAPNVQPVENWINYLKKQAQRNPAVTKVIKALSTEKIGTKLTKETVADMLDKNTSQFKTVIAENPMYGGREIFIQNPDAPEYWTDHHSYLSSVPRLSENLIGRIRSNDPSNLQDISQIQTSQLAPRDLQKAFPEFAATAIKNDALLRGQKEVFIPTGQTAEDIQANMIPDSIKKLYDDMPKLFTNAISERVTAGTIEGGARIANQVSKLLDLIWDNPRQELRQDIIDDLYLGADYATNWGVDAKEAAKLKSIIVKAQNNQEPITINYLIRNFINESTFDIALREGLFRNPRFKKPAEYNKIDLSRADLTPYLYGAIPLLASDEE